jgi:hypothetical protein
MRLTKGKLAIVLTFLIGGISTARAQSAIERLQPWWKYQRVDWPLQNR